MVTVIIDRVGHTNVFNLITGEQVENPALSVGESLQSITDDDLIEEFQEELNRIASISRSLSSLPKKDGEKQAILFQHLNLNTQLQQIGEAFFRQFFPDALQDFFKKSDPCWLLFHVTASLASIPFEILHDGQAFLWEKFFLGKSVKGSQPNTEPILPKDNLNMLVVVDPTEDLEWARKEGEMVFEHLSTKFPDKSLHIELLGGKSLNKLHLLNALQDKDLIHYSGHLHYTGTPDENGWKLHGNKVLHAREIKKSGAEPMLIFSNSCISGRAMEDEEGSWYTRFASSFIKSSKTAYIGTNWHVPDSEPTIHFTIKLYELLLEGKTLGEALHLARKHVRENFALNDLTWASYMLLGNPQARIFEAEAKIPDLSRDMLAEETVLEHYPFPIAVAYEYFKKQEKQETATENILQALFKVYDALLFFIGALLWSHAHFLNINQNIKFPYPHTTKVLDEIFKILSVFSMMHTRPVVPNLIEILYRHKKGLEKIAQWKQGFASHPSKNKVEPESVLVSAQFLLELFMADLVSFRNYGFYKIIEPGTRQLSLSGIIKFHRVKDLLLPTQTDAPTFHEISHKTEELMGKVVFYNPIKKLFLDLSSVLTLESKKHSNSYQVVYHAA